MSDIVVQTHVDDFMASANAAAARTAIGAAALASPALTGTPTAPTAGGATNTDQIATTAFVQSALAGVVQVLDGQVATFSDLPAAASHPGDNYLVRQSQGTYFVNRKTAGIYTSDGASWILDGDATEAYFQDTLAWTNITSKPSTFAPSTHSHPTSEITGLDTALSGNASTSHGHAIADVTGLQTALDGKQSSGSYAASSHTHATSEVTGLDAALAALGAPALSALTYSSTLDLAFTAAPQRRSLTLTGNITFTGSGYSDARETQVFITGDSSLRTLTFPSGWKFIGTKPSDIAASKVAVLSLQCLGSTEGSVRAAWGVET